MTKKNFLLHIIITLVIFVPSPPYIGYGIVLLLAFNIVFGVSIIFSNYIRDFEKKHRMPLVLLCAGLTTVLFHLVLSFFSPIIALTLGFILYHIPLSILAYDTLFKTKPTSNQENPRFTYKPLLPISMATLLFFIIREFFSFGTISYPTQSGIAFIQMPIQFFDDYAFVWSSIPGALFLLALFMVILPMFTSSKSKDEKTEDVIEEVAE